MWGFGILDWLESLAECYLPVSLWPYILFIGALLFTGFCFAMANFLNRK